jgi:hypothetical protein
MIGEDGDEDERGKEIRTSVRSTALINTAFQIGIRLPMDYFCVVPWYFGVAWYTAEGVAEDVCYVVLALKAESMTGGEWVWD